MDNMISKLQIINSNGFSIYRKDFNEETVDEQLFSGMISAISTVSNEVFNKEIGNIVFEENKGSVSIVTKETDSRELKIFFIYITEKEIKRDILKFISKKIYDKFKKEITKKHQNLPNKKLRRKIDESIKKFLDKNGKILKDKIKRKDIEMKEKTYKLIKFLEKILDYKYKDKYKKIKETNTLKIIRVPIAYYEKDKNKLDLFLDIKEYIADQINIKFIILVNGKEKKYKNLTKEYNLIFTKEKIKRRFTLKDLKETLLEIIENIPKIIEEKQ